MMNVPQSPAEPVTAPLLVPITLLYLDSFTAFFTRHKCLLEPTGEEIHNAAIYRVTFPPGTLKQRLWQAREPRYKIILPDGVDLEEVQTRKRNVTYSYISAPVDA